MAPTCARPLTHTPMPLAYEGAQYPKRHGGAAEARIAAARAALLRSLAAGGGAAAAAEPVDLPPSQGRDGGQCVRVRGVLTREQCELLVALSEAHGFERARVNMDFEGHDIPAVRNNWRTMIDDEAVAAELFRRVAPFLPDARLLGADRMAPCGTTRRFRVLRYDERQQFTNHKDGRYEDPETGDVSLLTLQVYLTDDFSEGGTAFVGDEEEEEEVHVLPAAGDAVFFSHGLVHRGVPPVGGRKYALRSEVMFRAAAPHHRH